MILALVGVTGVGKTYYKEKIVENLGFKKVNTIRTRKIRKGETHGKSGLFLTTEELDKLEKDDKIAYRFSVFGGEYAYLKDEIFTNENMVFEMHYTTIYDWKKICPNIKTIYIFPANLNDAKEQTKKRNLTPEKEEERIKELEEHYEKVKNDRDLRKQFDFIIYNHYNKDSEEEILGIVRNLMESN